MKLAAASAEQGPVLATVHSQAFGQPWTAAAFSALLEGAGVFALLAEVRGPAGIVLCRTVAGEAEILTLAVVPSARRSGVAQALMVAAIGLSRQAGSGAMFLEVGACNAAAVALYAQMGFVETGRRRAYYDRGLGEREDALIMSLDLTSPAR